MGKRPAEIFKLLLIDFYMNRAIIQYKAMALVSDGYKCFLFKQRSL